MKSHGHLSLTPNEAQSSSGMPLELWNLGVTSPLAAALLWSPGIVPSRRDLPLSVFPSPGFVSEPFFVRLTHRGPRARDISETFCQNFECRNN